MIVTLEQVLIRRYAIARYKDNGVSRSAVIRSFIFLRQYAARSAWRAAHLFLRQSFVLQHFATKPYQTVEIGRRKFSGRRKAEHRWEAIRSVIQHYSARSVMDIGCAEAWFLRRAAQDLGCFAIGIDSSRSRVILGETARLYDGVGRLAVMQASLQSADILLLPKCDVVLCLSVVHHVMRKKGIEEARQFVRALATRSEKAIIFEMGTADEKVMKWHDDVPQMPNGQRQFTEQFLNSCSLKNIREILATPSLKGDAERILYVAAPEGDFFRGAR